LTDTTWNYTKYAVIPTDIGDTDHQVFCPVLDLHIPEEWKAE